jgi:hypothetical protein
MDSSTRGRAGLVRSLVAVAALIAATLAFSAFASAGAKTLGTTTLKPDPVTFETLAGLGVDVTPTGKAEAGANGIGFPINKVNLKKNLTGTIDHKGGLLFASDTASVEVKNFEVKIGKEKAKLFADAGGASLRLLDLDLSNVKVGAGGNSVRKIRAFLARPGADALTAAFGAPIAKGTPIGEVKVVFKK